MTVIIGGGTMIACDTIWEPLNGTPGITAVSYSFSPGVQRLWELGSFRPYDIFVPWVTTLEISGYGRRFDSSGGSLSIPVPPATSCAEASFHDISISPATCLDGASPFADEYFITGYTYKKPNFGYGVETWSFTSRPVLSQNPITAPPGASIRSVVMLRGLAEGTMTVGQGFIENPGFVGVTIDTLSSNYRLSPATPIITTQGSVQAGPGSFGAETKTRSIIVTTVGNSMGNNDEINGAEGAVSISIPLTPMYL